MASTVTVSQISGVLSDETTANAFMAKFPGAYPEWQRAYSADDRQRSFPLWLKDHLDLFPNDEMGTFIQNPKPYVDTYKAEQTKAAIANTPPSNETFTTDELDKIKAIVDKNPDQSKILTDQFGGDLNKYANWYIDQRNQNPDAAPSAFDTQMMNTGVFGTYGGDGSGDVPLEQYMANDAFNKAKTLMDGDVQNAQLAEAMRKQFAGDYVDINNTLDSFTKQSVVDWDQYLAEHPDAEAYIGTAMHNGMTREQALQDYYDLVGKNRGDVLPKIDAQLAAEYNQADKAANNQLGFLKDQIDTQRAALDKAQAELLLNQDKYTDAEKAALQQALDTKRAALSSEIDQKKAALADEMTKLNGAADSYSQARLSALSEEMNSLNEAQKPLNEARLRSADSQMTQVNLGLESSKDQLAADMAKQGYIGSSAGDEMAMTRATIGARQNAAAIMGNAKVQNATDNTNIAQYGAKMKASILDEAAGLHKDIAFQNAGETKDVDFYGAGADKDLSYWGADQGQGIAKTDATNRLNINNWGTTSNQDLTNTLATDTYGIKATNEQNKTGLFSNDTARRLSLLTVKPQVANATLQTLSNLQDYSVSGQKKAQDLFNWYKIGTSQAAPAQTYLSTPNTTMGDAWANIGSGIGGAISSYGMMKYMGGLNKPTTTPAGATMSYNDFLKANPNSPAATGSLSGPG